MDAHEELVLRLAAKRRQKLGLSDSGYAELLLAVRANPSQFVEDAQDQAYVDLGRALARYDRSCDDDDLRDDDEFEQARNARLATMASDCDKILSADPTCTDARLLGAIARYPSDPDSLLDALDEAEREEDERHPVDLGQLPKGQDAWVDVTLRPHLRLMACRARTCLESARYRQALAEAERLLGLAPSDFEGARHTCALALARLEDEAGFDALEQRLSRHGDSWVELSRLILLFKLGRTGAARRALRGYDSLVEGGTYALLRPVYVDAYMPDRPQADPYSFPEATIAVYEADPIIMDVPGLPQWVDAQPGMHDKAERFAEENGLDW